MVMLTIFLFHPNPIRAAPWPGIHFLYAHKNLSLSTHGFLFSCRRLPGGSLVRHIKHIKHWNWLTVEIKAADSHRMARYICIPWEQTLNIYGPDLWPGQIYLSCLKTGAHPFKRLFIQEIHTFNLYIIVFRFSQHSIPFRTRRRHSSIKS